MRCANKETLQRLPPGDRLETLVTRPILGTYDKVSGTGRQCKTDTFSTEHKANTKHILLNTKPIRAYTLKQNGLIVKFISYWSSAAWEGLPYTDYCKLQVITEVAIVSWQKGFCGKGPAPAVQFTHILRKCQFLQLEKAQ